MSPAAAVFEEVALGWVRDVLELPAECGGAVVTGATMANFTGLAAARHALLERAGWDVESDGTVRRAGDDRRGRRRSPRLAVKSAGHARARPRARHRVAVDEQGRMRADALPALDGRTIVCMQAGNVNTGAFDPAARDLRGARTRRRLGARGRRVRTVGRGLAARAGISPRLRRRRLVGNRRAQVAQRRPTTAASRLVRDPDALRAAMAMSAAYLPGERSRAIAVHARDVAPRSRRRDLGGPALARPRRPRRPDRAHLPPCDAFRRRAARSAATTS